VAGELRNNGVTAASSHTTHDQDVKPWITPTPAAQAQTQSLALLDMANAALYARQSAAFLPQQVPPKEADKEQAELAAHMVEMVETTLMEEEEEEEEEEEQEEAAKAAPQQVPQNEADKEQAEQAEMEVSAGRAKQCSVSTSERLPTQRVRGVS
jgi:hypothetical protein